MKVQTLKFPLPPTLNDQINSARTHWTKSAQAKKKWTKLIADHCLGSSCFEGKVWITFDWYVERFSRDPDNIMGAAKFIMDGMKDAGVIKNDNLTIIQSPQLHSFDRGEDGVVVEISDSISLIIDKLEALKR
jgi:Holliday junction resolvase RusA-like endonuclease